MYQEKSGNPVPGLKKYSVEKSKKFPKHFVDNGEQRNTINPILVSKVWKQGSSTRDPW
jgi:hypothetical protein